MDEAGEYRTRSASLRGVVTFAPTAGDAMRVADPFANATQRGHCGYGVGPSIIPDFLHYQNFEKLLQTNRLFDNSA